MLHIIPPPSAVKNLDQTASPPQSTAAKVELAAKKRGGGHGRQREEEEAALTLARLAFATFLRFIGPFSPLPPLACATRRVTLAGREGGRTVGGRTGALCCHCKALTLFGPPLPPGGGSVSLS